MSDFTRRDVITKGSMIALGLATPKWFANIAHAQFLQGAKGRKLPKDTVLVVCQLSGGNDGLNTVIPYANSLYYKARPTIGISDNKVLRINEHLGLHPALSGMKQLFEEKKVAIIQGVGYPKPNRSHFKSMDIWQSASPDGKVRQGWLGRHFDHQMLTGPTNPVVALGLSTEKPLALTGQKVSIPCFASLVDIQSMVGDPDVEKMLRQIQGVDASIGSPARVVQQANKSALDAMTVLSKQLETFTPKQKYGNDTFGKGFSQIAQIVAVSSQTRVVYFSAGGFDTHARQAEQHDKLLGGLGNALLAFQREMEAIGKADNVVVLVFSEFGRRVAENASAGTDHGAAAPMFLIGNNVQGGIYGPIPNLNDLQDGDLKYAIDFRQVYATTLDKWLGGDSGVVLGEEFPHLSVL